MKSSNSFVSCATLYYVGLITMCRHLYLPPATTPRCTVSHFNWQYVTKYFLFCLEPVNLENSVECTLSLFYMKIINCLLLSPRLSDYRGLLMWPQTRAAEYQRGVTIAGCQIKWEPCISGEHAVGKLNETLYYKPEGRGFDSQWCHRNFSLTYSFRPHYSPGVDSASDRNKYQKYFLGSKGGRCVRLTTLPHSCAVCLEIWEPQPPGTLCIFDRPVQGLL